MSEPSTSTHDADEISVYRCPRTGDRLRFQDGALSNDDGTIVYRVTDGIPNFLIHQIPEPEDTQQKLERVNELARSGPWTDAVQEVYGEWGYVFPDGRDKWLELLSIDQGDTVLEIGSGMGQFSPLLSKQCDRFYALEVVPEQAEFGAERCRQEGCRNTAFAAGGDDCLLPFRDETFDWVVLNLVLEWCAMRKAPGGDIAAGQRQMLSEIRRVLKPGGQVYLMTKNRFALRLLLGKQDEHCYGMRWGNALPRWLMRLLLKRRGHEVPRGVLHSHNALERMVREAGFEQVESFWATPEMRYPTHCVSNRATAIRSARKQPGFVQGEYRSTRMLMRWIPARWVRHFTPGLQMIASKRG